MINREYRVVGLMSGTSLDGLDVVLAGFRYDGSRWKYSLYYGITLPWPDKLGLLLNKAHIMDAASLAELDFAFARYCGDNVKRICARQGFFPDLVASHGHTVFHQPDKGYTYQIGNGAVIAAVSGYRVVYDFRSADVAKGGQGAPLVPMGDHLLFSAYRYCLNLGGIANISTVSGNQRVAWDIVPANMVLNLLASRLGYLFDRDGQLAAEGALIPELLNQLEELAYFSSPPPKTLGREWMEHYLLPLLDQLYSVKDILRTYTEFVAMQINKEASANDGDLILVTGGGTWNRFLTERIASLTNAQLVIPEKTLIDFKEALIFGFLGLLRYLELDNVFGSVTGAPRDHSAGSIALP